jgi:hypothetical protein
MALQQQTRLDQRTCEEVVTIFHRIQRLHVHPVQAVSVCCITIEHRRRMEQKNMDNALGY